MGADAPPSIARHLGFAIPALVLSAIVYFPITRCYFYLDDFLNLYHIVNDSFPHYVLRENGGHVLLTRNALFYLTFLVAGPHPELFYWSAFLAHLVNVFLLYLLIARLTARQGVASFGAAFWGISPLNEGALSWYSVFGHVVVGTAVLLILVQASACLTTQRAPSRRLRGFWYFLAFVAMTSFGTGVGVAMLLPFVLFLLLYPIERRPPLLGLLVAVPVLYLGLTWLYEYTSGAEAPVRSIASGLFSSLPDVLWWAARVTGFGMARWLTGFVFPMPQPPAGWYVTLVLIGALVGAVAFLSPPAPRRQLAAFGLIVASAYGIVSIGRGAIMVFVPDATIQALTRYHYVAPIALTVMLCLVLVQLGRQLGRRFRLLVLATWYLVAGIGYARSDFVIEQHQLERDETFRTLASIRSAVDAQALGSTVRIPNENFSPFPLRSLVPGWAAVFSIFYPDNVVDGRRVEFVESAKYIIKSHGHGRRVGRVLVPPQPPGR